MKFVCTKHFYRNFNFHKILITNWDWIMWFFSIKFIRSCLDSNLQPHQWTCVNLFTNVLFRRLRGSVYKIYHDIRFITSNSVRLYVSSVFRKPLIHVFQAARFEIELFTYFADESEAIFHPMISTKNLNEHVIYNETNVKSPQGNKL